MILCIGTLSPRKNQLRLIQAYALLPQRIRRDFRLVLAGNRGWHDTAIVEAAAATEGVEWIGHVSEDQYEQLLASCTLLALPSLYEGFGMQVLDALARGVPVLTSDRGSLREVCGNAALYVDPESVPSIAQGLETLLSRPVVSDELRHLGPARATAFSWERTARLVLQAVESL